jgi:hypothetical protein
MILPQFVIAKFVIEVNASPICHYVYSDRSDLYLRYLEPCEELHCGSSLYYHSYNNNQWCSG